MRGEGAGAAAAFAAGAGAGARFTSLSAATAASASIARISSLSQGLRMKRNTSPSLMEPTSAARSE